MIKKNIGGKKEALSQIFLLVVSIVAFSYAVGSEVGGVSGINVPPGWKLVVDPLSVNRKLTTGTGPYSYTEGSTLYQLPDGTYRWIDLKGDIYATIKSGTGVGTPVGNPLNAGAGGQPPTTPTGIDPDDFYNNVEEQVPKSPLSGTECFEAPPGTPGCSNPDPVNVPPPIVPQEIVDANGWTKATCIGDGDFWNLAENTCYTSNLDNQVAAALDCAKTPNAPFCKTTFGSYIGKGFEHALAFKLAASLLLPIIGASGSQTEVIGNTGSLGFLLAGVAKGTIHQGITKGWWGAGATEAEAADIVSTWGNTIGWGIAAYYFLKNYKEEGTVTTSFSCLPWQPALSGKNCEKCNSGFLPCSEYQCKSLGQSCELVNKGTSDESCVWISKNDVSAPTIEALESALLNENYKYNPNDAILPPDRGVNVNYKPTTDSTPADNCVPAFVPLRIGVKLNEPAKCKIDTLRKDDFKTMEIEMSSGLLQYNHTFSLSLPGKANAETEGISVENDGNYDLFVRCEDANGNANVGTFVFKYCVDKGPDTTPPLIVATSVPNNMPIAYNQSVLDLQVYVNEPAECKWSHNNRDYATMEEQMDCQTTIGNTNAQGLYTCNANLKGLKDRFTNTFYFRCQDKSSTPNENAESFVYNVVGTQALVITSATPNDTTIKDSTSVVKVSFEAKTTAGYKDGEASCEYSDTGITDDYVKFFTTDSSSHKQDLFLPEGTYDYFIRCIDLGGNTDNKKISFTVESDNQAPAVVRAYHEEQYLKITTTEEAKCVYDTIDCTYDVKDGTPMTSIDGASHFTDWDIKSNLYVKCEDTYGNQPLPNACSIIVKSTTF